MKGEAPKEFPIMKTSWPIKVLTRGKKKFPSCLLSLSSPPDKLYYRGNWQSVLWKRSLVVVGSRRLTNYGMYVLEQFIPYLVSQGVTIISGFMYGVDTQAHRQCLQAGGKTVAVLGNGLEVIYPPENEKLYWQILKKGGVIISEYPPSMKARLWTFPRRNRLMVALASLGVLVVEAGENSGSLVTARWAEKLKKPLFAVPGPINSSVSLGTNWLIKTGKAKMVTTPEEILGEKHKKDFSSQAKESFSDYSPEEREILLLLAEEPLSLDEIAAALEKRIEEVSRQVSLLNLKGAIEEKGSRFWLKVSLEKNS